MSACPVCGSVAAAVLFTAANRHGRHLQEPAGEFPIAVCGGCGLLGPVGITADAAYYRTYYPQGYHEDAGGGLLAQLWGAVTCRRIRRRVRTISRLAGPHTGRIRLLDVGCGPGGFLSQLDRTQFDPHGFEPVAEAVAAAQAMGLDVIAGDVQKSPLPAAAYDVVTLWHVLEHLDRPEVALARLHTALAPGGLLVIATPNTASLACRQGREYWFHLDTPRHLHLFNKANLVQLLDQQGLTTLHCATQPFDYPLDLFWSLRRDWRCWPLLALYPLAKSFDRECLLVIARKREVDPGATPGGCKE